MVCDTEEVLLQASVKVHVRVMMTLQASALFTASTPVTVISPPQLSVAVKLPAAGTSVIHSSVTSAGEARSTGAVVSVMVMVGDTEEVLLQASVKVQVRVMMTL